MIKNKPDNIIKLSCKSIDDLFKYWLLFLKPFNHLTNKEMEVAVEFLKKRHELSSVINDDYILDSVIMNTDTKRSIREACGLPPTHFQIIIGKLRKNKFIIDNRINPKFIPNIANSKGSLQLLLYFDMSDE